MPNLFSFTKNKKILFFVFFFAILAGVAIPFITFAAAASSTSPSWWEYLIPGWNTYLVGKAIVGKGLSTVAMNGANAIILLVGMVVLMIPAAIATIAHGLLAGMMALPACIGGQVDANGVLLAGCRGGYTFGTSYTHLTGSDANVAVAAGWPVVRDLANMFIVLGFVIIGIATSLRIREYEAKQLLVKLIIAALLINFSLLFCGIIIDGSNITIKYFINGGGSFGDSMMKSINNGANMWKSAYDDNPANPISTFGMIAGILFYDIVAIVIFFLYFFLFLFRYMALWILVILSPLAFVSYVFPFTKKFWDLWWNNFLQWCIIGIPAAFFMWLADKILSGMIKSADVSSVGFATYLVPGMMLIIGFLFTLQTSAMGASSVISAAKWAGKGTGGAIKELTGRSKTGQKYREKAMRAVDRIAETAGFSKQGTAMINASAREKSEMATINALRTSSNPADQSRYEQLVKTGQGARGAAAIAAAIENGDLFRILNPNNDAAGLDQIKARVALAKAFGHESGEFTKKNYQLKQFDTKAVDKALTGQGLDPALVSPGDARRTKAEQDVMMAQLADNLPQMSGAEMGNVDSRHLGITNHEFTRENITPHMVQKIGASSNAALIESVKRDYLNFFKDMNDVAKDMNDAKRDGNKAEENRLRKIMDRLRKIMEAIDKLP